MYALLGIDNFVEYLPQWISPKMYAVLGIDNIVVNRSRNVCSPGDNIVVHYVFTN